MWSIWHPLFRNKVGRVQRASRWRQKPAGSLLWPWRSFVPFENLIVVTGFASSASVFVDEIVAEDLYSVSLFDKEHLDAVSCVTLVIHEVLGSNPAQASCSSAALHGESPWQVKTIPLACREIFGLGLWGLNELVLGVWSDGLVACNSWIGKPGASLNCSLVARHGLIHLVLKKC